MAWQPTYATAAELKSFVRITDTDDDAQIALALEAASRAIDNATNRQFGVLSTEEERKYTAEYDRRRGRWVIVIDDLMDDDNLVITTDSGTVDVYELQPVNAPQLGRPWFQIVVDPTSAVSPTRTENGVTIDGLWGWTAVPDAIKQATLLQASRIFSRRQSPYGIAGSPDLGSELRLLAKLDPDVAVTVNPYIRWWAVA